MQDFDRDFFVGLAVARPIHRPLPALVEMTHEFVAVCNDLAGSIVRLGLALRRRFGHVGSGEVITVWGHPTRSAARPSGTARIPYSSVADPVAAADPARVSA